VRNMNEELKQKLLKEINKSGFPLELNVIEKLRNAEIIVYPNLNFSDDADKPREIDAYAVISDRIDCEQEWPFGCIHLDLFVECKSSPDKPWVFFNDPGDINSMFGLVDRLEWLSDLDVKDSLPLLVSCQHTALKEHHYNSGSWGSVVPVARTYCEAFGKDAGKDIYQAVTNIWHTLDFQKRWFESSRSEMREMPKKRTIFMHGVIVYRGVLVAAEKVDDSFELTETPHIMLRTTDCVTDKSLPFGSQRETVIDIVHEDFFEDYLTICQKDMNVMVNHLLALLKAGWLS
jgi:hypothetical protein